MRLIRRDDAAATFLLDPREKEILFQLLSRFPATHGPVSQISRFGDSEKTRESQQLLEEAMAEHRAAGRRELQRWMESPGAVRVTEKGCQLRLEPERAEWLLQILNDIRIGNWIKLGSPTDLGHPPVSQGLEQSRLWADMETAGYFEAALLASLDRPIPPQAG